MPMVNTPTSQERPPKSLSTVNRDGERAFVPPSRLSWVGGGSIFRIAIFSFSAKTNPTGRLVNAFYATNGTQTIIFAIFVSMNPPNHGMREQERAYGATVPLYTAPHPHTTGKMGQKNRCLGF